MTQRRPRRSAIALLALVPLAAGCMVDEAVPLATARIVSVAPCGTCRDEGAVSVRIEGDDALADAVIVLHDLRVKHELGQQPAAVGRADAHGRWDITLHALRVPGRVELPVLPGDTLEVFQKNGEGDASDPFRLTVPTPQERPAGAPVFDELPQAASPSPSPSGP